MEQALFDATTAEQVDLVRELLQNPSINVNWGEKDFDRTALIRACFKGNREIVRLLLNDPRVLINRRQAQGATALNIASQYQQADVLEELLQDPRVDVNLPNDEGGSPFFYACAFGSLPCFRLLLAHPLVRVDQRNNHGTTPFLLACDADVSLEIFDALVTHPDVDVNRGNSQGVTPLHVVAWGSHPTNVRKVRELLKRQANVNAANVGGITPVDRAVQSDSIPILKEMMVSGQVLNIDRISRKNLSKKMAALLQSYQNDREKVIFDLQAEFGHPGFSSLHFSFIDPLQSATSILSLFHSPTGLVHVWIGGPLVR